MSACVAVEGAEWAASAQHVASVSFLSLLVIASIAAYTLLPVSDIKIPRRPLREQVFYIAVGLESVAIGFLFGYIAHLLPCFWENCHLSTDATASAIILVVVWPVATVALIVARMMGYSMLSLFELAPPAEYEDDESESIGSTLFKVPSLHVPAPARLEPTE